MAITRHRKIITTSIIGIMTNLLLVIFKIIVGLLSNSIAIILDAVNNFSDMLSSIVTIIGTFFARVSPDREHPMGHGRSEYLSATMVAIIIMYIGLTALIESIKKIIAPEAPDYSIITIAVVSVAIVIKLLLGLYVYRVGRDVNSDALVGSGKDALFDAAISLTTLIAAVTFIIAGFNIEAYLATLISIIIIYSGFRMLRETFSLILGERANPDLSQKIRAEVRDVEGVKGAYDLVLHDYGPNAIFASINIELLDTVTVPEIDDISHEIRRRIYYKYHVVISSVGIYSINTHSDKIVKLRKQVYDVISSFEYVIQMYGFYVDEKTKEISINITIGFDVKNRDAYRQKMRKALEEAIPGYSFGITLNSDFSD